MSNLYKAYVRDEILKKGAKLEALYSRQYSPLLLCTKVICDHKFELKINEDFICANEFKSFDKIPDNIKIFHQG